MDGDLEAMEALLGRLDGVEAPTADLDADPARLGQAGLGTQQLGFVVDDPGDAQEAARLLVRGAREDDVAAQPGDGIERWVEAGRDRLPGQSEHDLQLHGRHALHVHGAASVDVAVGDLAAERIARPALRICGHHVQVGQQEQRPCRQCHRRAAAR